MINKLDMMNTKFKGRNESNKLEKEYEYDEIFDLNSPNKKNPMSYEIESVITLLKIIYENIILLDPVDEEL